MSPEQILMSAELGPAADIWALGVVAFECLTGKHPFVGKNVLEVFAAIQLGQARSARALVPSLPKAFEKWFARACAVHAADRFPDAVAATNALSEALLGVGAERAKMSESEAPGPLDRSGRRPVASTPTLVETARKPGFPFPIWAVALAATLAGGAIAVALRTRTPDAVPPPIPPRPSAIVSSSPLAPSADPSADPSAAATASASGGPATSSSIAKPSSPPTARATAREGTAPVTSKTEPTVRPTATAPPASAPTASATAKSPFTLPPLGL
jgi:serine/threonine-protein kinase